MVPDTASANVMTRPEGASTAGGHQPGGEQPGRRPGGPAGPLTAAAKILAGISGAARRGEMDTAAALTAITAARSLAAELEHGELAFIDAARGDGRPGPRSPPRWAPATARPPRNATPTSHAAAPVHQQWTPRPNRSPASRKTRTATARRARPPPVPGTLHQPGQAGPHGITGRTAPFPGPFLPRQQRMPSPRRLSPSAASGNIPCRRSPAPSSARASTSSSGHPAITRPVPGTSSSAGRGSAWSVPPGGESGAGPDGNRSTTPASRCPPPESAGSRLRATPGPATPQRSACSAHSSASSRTTASTSVHDDENVHQSWTSLHPPGPHPARWDWAYSDGSNTCCDMRSHVVSEYVKGGRLMPKT